MYQRAARRHAAPAQPAIPGVPLIKVAPSLGRMLETRRFLAGGGSNPAFLIPVEWAQARKKEEVRRQAQIAIDWARKEDGANFRRIVRIEGPLAHFDPHENHVQYGDAGGKREVARQFIGDSTPEYEDYRIYIEFDVPEGITELPTEMAAELMAKGNKNMRPLREAEWAKTGRNIWSQRN